MGNYSSAVGSFVRLSIGKYSLFCIKKFSSRNLSVVKSASLLFIKKLDDNAKSIDDELAP